LNIRNCKRCGTIFQYAGNRLCHQCLEKDEEDFKRVKEYLDENFKATITEVANNLEISVEKIRGYMRDGRIEVVANSGMDILSCDSCGTSISKGRFCASCQSKLVRGLNQAGETMGSGKSSSQKDEDKEEDPKRAFRFVKKD
jgi:flagellar operon protein (TIGR03826 family)